jgi:DNA-binding transcriptional regulator YiaG
MPTSSSFKERFARVVAGPATDPAPSATGGGEPACYLLRAAGNMPQRIELARVLVRSGLGPQHAHKAVTRLAETLLHPEDQRPGVPVLLPSVPDARALERRLAELEVRAERRVSPEVDAKAVRATTGLTQEEFALRFGLDLATLRNWEQGRTRPDGPARVLLKVIEREPRAVEAALAG